MKKSIPIYVILYFVLGCNSPVETTYVKEFSKPDSSTHYSITYDKSGNVIDEYKSKDYTESEAQLDKMLAKYHLYSIEDLRVEGISISTESQLKGEIVGSKNGNDSIMILRSEIGEVKALIEEDGKFKFSNLPTGTCVLLVSSTSDQLTLIGEIVLNGALDYKLTINRHDE